MKVQHPEVSFDRKVKLEGLSYYAKCLTAKPGQIVYFENIVDLSRDDFRYRTYGDELFCGFGRDKDDKPVMMTCIDVTKPWPEREYRVIHMEDYNWGDVNIYAIVFEYFDNVVMDPDNFAFLAEPVFETNGYEVIEHTILVGCTPEEIQHYREQIVCPECLVA